MCLVTSTVVWTVIIVVEGEKVDHVGDARRRFDWFEVTLGKCKAGGSEPARIKRRDFIGQSGNELLPFYGERKTAWMVCVVPIPAANIDRAANIRFVEQVPRKYTIIASKITHNRTNMKFECSFVVIGSKLILRVFN